MLTSICIDTEMAVPQLLRSSTALGWQDIEVQTYLEPLHAEQWAEPVSADITIVLVTQGRAQFSQYGRACKGMSLQKHDVLLKPAATPLPDLRWQTLSKEAVQTLRLTISHALYCRTIAEVTDRDPADLTLGVVATARDPLLVHIGLTLGHELESPSPMSALYAQTAAQMLIVHLARTYALKQAIIQDTQTGLTDHQVQRIREYVQAHLTQPISLDDMASQIGFSPYHFARLFRKVIGESPYQFVLRQRVGHAQKLLHSGTLTLAEVAVESGFADQSHLTQTFKRYTGLTPKAYRRIL